jgi:hypothetical protein
MTSSFLLADALDLGDLSVFLGRAGRVDDGSVRLIASSGVLAAYVGVLYPAGILDRSPTVLALRAFGLPRSERFDVVVPIRAMLDRLARATGEVADRAETDPVELALPVESGTATWAGISPPRSGWRPHGELGGGVASETLERAARDGIDEIARVIPSGTGEQIVGRVRSEVWGRDVDGAPGLPAGAAFAAYSLGFLGAADAALVYENGPWLRLSTSRGHVLVRRAGGTLLG